ncbi:MAG: hypothetical protein BWY57_03130 [Betaproteobacteria bacterium ADurb.Bin341]|nr:MAG: hypothetical protein BWY57_03130 [Betaproteobacteria bacterium ADurb.Bin341]
MIQQMSLFGQECDSVWAIGEASIVKNGRDERPLISHDFWFTAKASATAASSLATG